MRWRAAPAIALMGALILALPSVASANWLHKGQGELKENASITMSGEVTLTTSAGNVSCPTSIGATLTKESTAGDVNSYAVSEPSKCDLTGSLGSICGTHGLTKVEKTGTWGLTASESDIAVSSIDLHFTFAGCLISSFRLKGSATMSVNKASTIISVGLSGSQDLYNASGEKAGTGSLEGTLSVSPTGTYGIQTAPKVNTKWRMDDELLSEDGELTLNGAFSFSYSGGAVSCPATAKLSLKAGEVEEEEPEGEVKSFAVSKPAECDVTGALKTLCGTNVVTSVEKTGSWSLTTNGADISISGLSLDYKFEKCAVTSLRVEGGATLTVDDPTEIGEATFGGTPSVYNAGGENLGTAELGGVNAVSPGGTFAIAPAPSTAFHFTYEHEPVGKETKVTELTGSLAFSAGAIGGIECEAHPKLSVRTADATLETLNFTTNTCKYTGAFAHCELATHELTPEVTVTPVGEDEVTIDNFRLTENFATAVGESETPCAIAGLPLELTFSSIDLEATINKTGTITGFNVTGSAGGVLDIEPSTPIAGVERSGTFTVSGEPTISISEVET